jgi:hypothetical protein
MLQTIEMELEQVARETERMITGDQFHIQNGFDTVWTG